MKSDMKCGKASIRSGQPIRCLIDRFKTDAAKSRFQTHRRMYEMGQLDIDRLMPSQEAYVMALRDQNTALVQYNLSINRWHYVTGQMTLDNIDNSSAGTSFFTDDR